ncbi:hypothetical protein TWF718_004674 [Orbilia javanica]|uniref:J domain-containing protein n=1 Tax=Orbilia javanica TaxID=47235 RepID=A0AAN8N355_9PEZI
MQDHYAVLGILLTATETEIKQAYRKAAFRTHPDKNNGSAKANEEFKKVIAAFECLSDPLKRASYNRGYKPPPPPQPTSSNPPPSPPFSKPSNTRTTNSFYSGPSSPRTSTYPPPDPGSYSTPQDILDEEVRLFQKWRSHREQKASMDARKKLYRETEGKIAMLKELMNQVHEQRKAREEERKFKTTRTWLGGMVWGNIVLPEEEVRRYEEADRQDLMEINSLRIRIAGQESELRRMQSYPREWGEWTKQEGVRIQEEAHLKFKKEKRRAEHAAEQAAKAKRKAEEEKRERDKKAREETEKRQKAWAEQMKKQEEAAAEARRKAQEEAEKVWANMKKAEDTAAEERRRKAREAAKREKARIEKLQKEEEAAAEARRKAREAQRERERKTRTQNERLPKTTSTGNPGPSQTRPARPPRSTPHVRPAAVCTHNLYWKKADITYSESCQFCHQKMRRFIFECPGCQTRACASCRDILKKGISPGPQTYPSKPYSYKTHDDDASSPFACDNPNYEYHYH